MEDTRYSSKKKIEESATEINGTKVIGGVRCRQSVSLERLSSFGDLISVMRVMVSRRARAFVLFSNRNRHQKAPLLQLR